ncbi:MAG: hypothetical protein FVQ81_00865 [Candidatus Glassbacteria bacterium]|nr:hypothetical protein [Candidatus Glassbacteria bacterium]
MVIFISSGANVAAAAKLLEGPCRGRTVAVMLCDSGLKYLSTDLWPPLDQQPGALPTSPP